MDIIFSQEQVDKLKSWKRSLNTPEALRWKVEEDKAEVEINTLLEMKNFQKGGILTSDDFDKMFRLMKKFSSNQALTKLVYINNGLELFNEKLRKLYYGEAPFQKRVDEFLNLSYCGVKISFPRFILFIT